MALADDIIVQHLEDFLGRGHAFLGLHEGGLVLLPDDLHAQLDAFIADENRRTRDQLAHLMLALAAKGARTLVLGSAAAGLAHRLPPGPFDPFFPPSWADRTLQPNRAV